MVKNAVSDAPSDAPPVVMGDMDLIDPSPLNRKCADDDQKVLSLADSIREMGLLAPIAVRPKADGRFEIIYGERRWRACRRLGFARIPCQVKDVSEVVAQAERITENLQRQSLTPLEQGEGVAAYLEINGRDYAEAANRFGYSEAWIRRRSKLPNLVPEWRAAVETDAYRKIGESVDKVEELAMLPAETQRALLEEGLLLYVTTTADMRKKIAAWCMNLEHKPWSREWEKRNFSSGKRCDACFKRSDKEKTLFDGLHETLGNEKAKLCLDPECWLGRVMAYCKDLLASNPGAIPLWDGYMTPKAEKIVKEHFGVKPPEYWEWEDVDPDGQPDDDQKEVQAVFVGGARAGMLATVWLRGSEEDEEFDAGVKEQAQNRKSEWELENERRQAAQDKAEGLIPERFGDLKALWGCDDMTALASLLNWAAWFGLEPAEYHSLEEGEPELDFLDIGQGGNPVVEHVWRQVRADLRRLAVDALLGDGEDEPEGTDRAILAAFCDLLRIDLKAAAADPEAATS